MYIYVYIYIYIYRERERERERARARARERERIGWSGAVDGESQEEHGAQMSIPRFRMSEVPLDS